MRPAFVNIKRATPIRTKAKPPDGTSQGNAYRKSVDNKIKPTRLRTVKLKHNMVVAPTVVGNRIYRNWSTKLSLMEQKEKDEFDRRFQACLERYTPQTIGVGITTHNRYDVFKEAYENICRFTPEAKIVVVDDASRKPVPEANFRFERNVGVAVSKNKCLELLDDCEHIFLFDDDCWPTREKWYVPYVLSPYLHLSYNWGRHEKISPDKMHIFFTKYHPVGVMLYYNRKILERLGGFDVSIGRFGAEHTEFSKRIEQAGLVPFRYIDINGGKFLFHSLDENGEVKSSVSSDYKVRNHLFIRGTNIMNSHLDRYRKTGVIPYMPYKKIISYS